MTCQCWRHWRLVGVRGMPPQFLLSGNSWRRGLVVRVGIEFPAGLSRMGIRFRPVTFLNFSGVGNSILGCERKEFPGARTWCWISNSGEVPLDFPQGSRPGQFPRGRFLRGDQATGRPAHPRAREPDGKACVRPWPSDPRITNARICRGPLTRNPWVPEPSCGTLGISGRRA